MVRQAIVTGYFLYSIIFPNTTDVLQTNREIHQTSGCVLPSHPDNGRWRLIGGFKDPGDTVPVNSVLEFECKSNYKLSNNKHVTCSNGWSPHEMPKCEDMALCPPQVSTSATFQCFDETEQEINCTEATHGSYMKYNCRDSYEPVPGQREIIYCIDGIWDTQTPECRPTCGYKNDEITSLSKLQYPWLAAIYKKENGEYVNICGATIIHRKAVLTAAHCVTDGNGFGLPVDNYEVAAGKYNNRYGDPRDDNVQYLKVLKFIVHFRYKYSRRLLADIALVITQLPFQFNSLVKPVCVNDFNTLYLQPGDIGEMAQWGVDDKLSLLKLQNKHSVDCVQKLSPDWAENYNLTDKICAGYPERNISVCNRDSGTGLYIRNSYDNRYYVRGIVSLPSSTVNKDTCSISSNAYYTNVSVYYKFIDRSIDKVKWCKLPNYPKNGKWQLQKHSNKSPGDIVSSFDIIEVLCDEGYELTTTNSTVDCETLVLNPSPCKATQSTPLDVSKVTTNVLEDQTTQTPTALLDETNQESLFEQKPMVLLDSSTVTTNHLEDQTIQTSTILTDETNQENQITQKSIAPIDSNRITSQLEDQTTPTSTALLDETNQESLFEQEPIVPLDSSKVTTNRSEDQTIQTSTISTDETNQENQITQKSIAPIDSNRITSQLEDQTTQTSMSSPDETTQENQTGQKTTMLLDSKVTNQFEVQTTQTSPVSLNETNQENQIGQKTTVSLDSEVATTQISITSTHKTNQENQITQKSIAPLGSSRITTNQMADQTTQTSTDPINSSEVSEQCGGKVNGSSSDILNSDGEFTKHVDYPWLVIIYQGKSYKGHGSIISRKLVITGARVLTLWNVWTLISYKDITVGTGKYFKFINDPRDSEAKYYDAEHTFISEKFNGIDEGVHNDIGFVVVRKPIEYDKWIQPICIEGVNDIVLRAEDILEITGWVNTDNVAVATPITNGIIVKKIGRCLRESSPLGDYLSPDAICGGPVDNTTCIGHSGSGLVYKNPKNNRYYLTAMYSFGVTSCVGKNNLYISIKYHYNYVIEQIKKYN